MRRLTVGVIARDGLPYLDLCLRSLPPLTECAEQVEFILVDAASTDATLAHMLRFAEQQPDTRVYSMVGTVNHAATRNVVVRNARPGAVFLVDGDIAVEPAFVRAALAEIEAGNCDVAFGQLPEILHDGRHRRLGRGGDRYKVTERRLAGYFCAVVVLGPKVVESGMHYDESIRWSDDLDLGLRVAERFRILMLPMPMGTHYTISYYNPDRIGQFWRQAYARPTGQLIRRHLHRPRRLWALAPRLKGPALGLALQVLTMLAVLGASPRLLALAAGLYAVDVARFAWQRRLQQYLPIRFLSVWQILHGLIRPERVTLYYEVHERWPASANASDA